MEENAERKPRWRHFQCDGCRFFGGLALGRDWIDLYQCGHRLVIRYGNHPCEEGHATDNYLALLPDEAARWLARWGD